MGQRWILDVQVDGRRGSKAREGEKDRNSAWESKSCAIDVELDAGLGVRIIQSCSYVTMAPIATSLSGEMNTPRRAAVFGHFGRAMTAKAMPVMIEALTHPSWPSNSRSRSLQRYQIQQLLCEEHLSSLHLYSRLLILLCSKRSKCRLLPIDPISGSYLMTRFWQSSQDEISHALREYAPSKTDPA